MNGDMQGFSNDNGSVQFQCPCGYLTPLRATWEAAGRDLDQHLAQVFPRGTERLAHNCKGVAA